ncbi:BLUF domain-containing protein [Antarcticibacterium flavum]|uniref:BLUF domain-containing protein n=1 Tax=Antarcticibacterium flavum TaxID=2058175 RepID=A0A5B7X2Y7_9FLAO|nr:MULTISPECIES: BLUF domain-containing protein [Antarcticibacterium]MCM4161274.1 hypothetical protein [Antarcticibacterium sp. W02-3]QCY69062.1 BLUF domain-containing protein [Antarcticibacterium flavum]
MFYSLSLLCTVPSDILYPEIKEALKNLEFQNRSNSLNGLLVFAEGNIFLVLEGEKNTVELAYKKLQKNPILSKIITVFKNAIEISTIAKPIFLICDLTFHPLNIDKSMKHLVSRMTPTSNAVKEILKAFAQTANKQNTSTY